MSKIDLSGILLTEAREEEPHHAVLPVSNETYGLLQILEMIQQKHNSFSIKKKERKSWKSHG